MSRRNIIFTGFACTAIVIGLWQNAQDKVRGLPCLFRWATNYSCPGCGTQRALHAVCHGEWKLAWSYNYFLPFALLLLMCLFGLHAWEKTRKLYHYATAPLALVLYALLTAAWTIARNYYGC